MGIAQRLPVTFRERRKEARKSSTPLSVKSLQETPVTTGRQKQVLVREVVRQGPGDRPSGQILVNDDHFVIQQSSASPVPDSRGSLSDTASRAAWNSSLRSP